MLKIVAHVGRHVWLMLWMLLLDFSLLRESNLERWWCCCCLISSLTWSWATRKNSFSNNETSDMTQGRSSIYIVLLQTWHPLEYATDFIWIYPWNKNRRVDSLFRMLTILADVRWKTSTVINTWPSFCLCYFIVSFIMNRTVSIA